MSDPLPWRVMFTSSLIPIFFWAVILLILCARNVAVASQNVICPWGKLFMVSQGPEKSGLPICSTIWIMSWCSGLAFMSIYCWKIANPWNWSMKPMRNPLIFSLSDLIFSLYNIRGGSNFTTLSYLTFSQLQRLMPLSYPWHIGQHSAVLFTSSCRTLPNQISRKNSLREFLPTTELEVVESTDKIPYFIRIPLNSTQKVSHLSVEPPKTIYYPKVRIPSLFVDWQEVRYFPSKFLSKLSTVGRIY